MIGDLDMNAVAKTIVASYAGYKVSLKKKKLIYIPK